MERKIKWYNYLSYGMGDFLGGGSFAIIGLLFFLYMTEVVGMIPAYAGMVMFIARIWDGVSDPLMGYISDRTRSRFGRRRIFFLIGFVPVGIFFALLWSAVNFESQWSLFAWYLFLFIGFSTFFTILMVPYTALNAEMSLDYKIRSKLSGVKQLCSGASGAICSVFSLPLVNLFESQQTGFMVLGIIFGLFFSLPWIAVFFGTWEVTVQQQDLKKKKFSEIITNFVSVFKNRSFRTHIGMYISGFGGMDVMMAVFVLFLTYYVGRGDLFPYLMASLAAAQGIFLPIYIFIANRLGKGKAYLIGTILFLAGMAYSVTLAPGASLSLLIVSAVLIGSGMCGVTVMPWVILPSVTDVDELITADKRAGTYSGMMTLMRKLTNATVIMLIGFALTYIGYVPDQTQSPQTAEGLRTLFLLGPTILVIIGLLFSLKFRITPGTHEVLRDEINRLEAGGSKGEVCRESREVCELLTGMDYEQLYLQSNTETKFNNGNKKDFTA